MLDPEEGKQSVGAAFSADGHEFFVLTYDGQLNVIEAETGEVEDVSHEPLVDHVEPGAAPSFVVVGEMLYLADRAGGRVIEYSLADMETEREWLVAGDPSRIAFLGISGGGQPSRRRSRPRPTRSSLLVRSSESPAGCGRHRGKVVSDGP